MKVLRVIGTYFFGFFALIGILMMLKNPDLVNLVFFVVTASVTYWLYLPKLKAKRAENALAIAAQKQKAIEIQQLVQRINGGEKPLVSVRAVILRENETAHFSVQGILMEEKVTGYEAGTTSVRVRVAKGVSVGQSGTRGKAVRGIVPVSNGEFVITNSRIVFAGEVKSFDIPLSKLTNFHFLDNKSGVVLHVGSKSHMVSLPSQAVPVAEALLRSA